MTVTQPTNENDESRQPLGAHEHVNSGGHSAVDDEPVIATIDETAPIARPAAGYQATEQEILAQQQLERQPSVHVVNPQPVQPTVESQPKVVYVNVPPAPRKKGNRIIGSLIALAAAVVFALLLAVVFALLWASFNGNDPIEFTGRFFIPVILFAVGLVLFVLLANRAGWWAYIIGSLAVAALVYFGTAAGLVLIDNVISQTPQVATQWYSAALLNPLVIIAGLLAREVAMWTGMIIGRRGRKVKARNVEARANYDREQAEREAAQRAS